MRSEASDPGECHKYLIADIKWIEMGVSCTPLDKLHLTSLIWEVLSKWGQSYHAARYVDDSTDNIA